jgi:hypothetical protein
MEMNVMQSAQPEKPKAWKNAYEAALLEVQPVKLGQRLIAAEKAIEDRFQELDGFGGKNRRELLELDDAKRVLALLRSYQAGEGSLCDSKNREY